IDTLFLVQNAGTRDNQSNDTRLRRDPSPGAADQGTPSASRSGPFCATPDSLIGAGRNMASFCSRVLILRTPKQCALLSLSPASSWSCPTLCFSKLHLKDRTSRGASNTHDSSRHPIFLFLSIAAPALPVTGGPAFNDMLNVI